VLITLKSNGDKVKVGDAVVYSEGVKGVRRWFRFVIDFKIRDDGDYALVYNFNGRFIRKIVSEGRFSDLVFSVYRYINGWVRRHYKRFK
jgi:hypothetical protein